MPDPAERDRTLAARVVLVDPATITVTWMNESAARSLAGEALAPGAPLDDVVPMAGALGLTDVVRAVAETGQTRHVETGLVSTPRGSVRIVTGVHRLPGGAVLLVSEHAWQTAQRSATAGASGRQPRRGR